MGLRRVPRRALLTGDEAFSSVLEQDLLSRQRGHWMLIGLLFGGSALMVVTAFLTMKPPKS